MRIINHIYHILFVLSVLLSVMGFSACSHPPGDPASQKETSPPVSPVSVQEISGVFSSPHVEKAVPPREYRRYLELEKQGSIGGADRDVIDWMGIKPGHVVADIGCGPGFYKALFSATVGEKGRVYMVDYDENARIYHEQSMELLKKNKEIPWSNITFVLNDTESFGLPEKFIDHVFMNRSHIWLSKDPMEQEMQEKLILNLRKILKDDGRFLYWEAFNRDYRLARTPDELKTYFIKYDFNIERIIEKPGEHPEAIFIMEKKVPSELDNEETEMITE